MDTVKPMYRWNTIPWKKIHKNVFKLQKRIYQASSRSDVKTVRKLQRLLMRSWSARLLAVRKVTQDNKGKKTAGVDGVKSLTAKQRLAMSETLRVEGKAQPVRRAWIAKDKSNEKRPLGIPTMHDRALQTLVKLALEPQWEAHFEPNSYGFRPGRSCHDAIGAIFNAINRKAKYVLDADIEKCFEQIDHAALLKKINTNPSIARQLKKWLKVGVMEDGKLFPTESGTIQGGNISPLLSNIALHGLETTIIKKFPSNHRRRFRPPQVIRYGDDLVVLHQDLEIIEQCQEVTSEWLKEMGLKLRLSKTRISHTLKAIDEKPGFDFLGFNIRQYPVGKTRSGNLSRGRKLGFKTLIKPSKAAMQGHVEKLRKTIKRDKHADQERLIKTLNPIIIGWSNYYSHVVSKKTFQNIKDTTYAMLRGWAVYRHPKKNKGWITSKYWRVNDGKGWIFQPDNSGIQLYHHHQTPIKRYVKVKGSRSMYDGDWIYWSKRLGRHPGVKPRMSKLLREQQGKCQECGLYFMDGEELETDHIIPRKRGGSDAINNRQLLHKHCHHRKTARDKAEGAYDKRQVAEEPDERKRCAVSRTERTAN